MVDLGFNLFGQIHKVAYLERIPSHQRQIRRLFAQVATRVNRNGQIRLDEGRGIIDAVTNHGHQLSLLLQC